MIDNNGAKLIDEIQTVIATENSEDELLRKAIELIDGFSEHYNWTGFYITNGSNLEVGPYVGEETPHKTIPLGQGICGAAATEKQTVVVDDVHSDPRFLACSLSTKSEIVVPLMDGDICLGEIDIDSNRPNNFDMEDQLMLEAIAEIVVARLKQIRK